MLRLLLLALVLALVLWWAVAVAGGPHRPVARREPRKLEKPPNRFRADLWVESPRAGVAELVLIDRAEIPPTVTDEVDDYWPDIIDA